MDEIKGRFIQLLKYATVGLMGDRAESITLGDLYSRVQEQANRIGVYAPSWAAFVETVAGCNFLKLGVDRPDPNAVVVTFVYGTDRR